MLEHPSCSQSHSKSSSPSGRPADSGQSTLSSGVSRTVGIGCAGETQEPGTPTLLERIAYDHLLDALPILQVFGIQSFAAGLQRCSDNQ